jgi:hypothetical protein
MSKFIESLSGGFANNWLIRVLSPAFVFWTVGFLAVTGGLSSRDALQNSLDPFVSQNELHWIVPLILAFVSISASAWIVERFTLPVTRLLEGYWPDICGFWQWRVSAAQKRWDKIYAEWNRLSKLSSPSIKDTRDRTELDHILRRCPTRDRLLPTRLGNILCAAETRPIGKYGLDAVICWPRIWLLLPDHNRADIASARASMDDGVRLVLWGMLSLIWAIWVWWLIPIAIIIVFISYRITLAAAGDFSDLMEAAFDTRRSLLYEALGWPMPKTPAEERASGEALTKYLLRGSDAPSPQLEFRRTSS